MKVFSNLIWCSVVLSCPRWWEVEQFSQLLEQGYELVKSVFKPFYKSNWGIHSIQVHVWTLTSYVGHWTQDPWCLSASHDAENIQMGESINNLPPTFIFPTLQSTNRHDILVCPSPSSTVCEAQIMEFHAILLDGRCINSLQILSHRVQQKSTQLY